MRPATLILLLLPAGAGVARAQDTATRPIQTEGSRLAVRGGEIWYRVVGGGATTPVVLLHGGPGISSVYLRSLEALADERIVVRYDQLGAGKSDRVTDTALFTIPGFVAELETLRRHLALERIHLYGHSWGATLAVEYYRAHPQHVASLTLASEALDAPAFYANMRRLFLMMPDSLSRAVRLKEAGLPHDSAAYQAAMMELYRRYGTRKPVLAEMDTLARSMNQAISDYMTGTSVFAPNGTLRQYDATPFLEQVKVPALFTVGEYDFVGPGNVRRHAGLTPGARLVVIPGAGHLTQWDNPAANLDAVRSFLRTVDARR
ncbi:MAG TPA: proline iminopeptidase-family hydrolase [Gemmatimonadales bacterium]|nr:proline iminopeptidase-family hydrolase [Gemmatimonadales bacterium]